MKKLFSILLSFVIAGASLCAFPMENTSALTVQEQRLELKQKLEQTEKKLKQIGAEKKDTEEYLDVLDEKLDLLKHEYTLARQEIDDITDKVSKLENSITDNEATLKDIHVSIREYNKSITLLNQQFDETYESFCNRMRAIYISGETESILSFILGSNGIENLLTRLQMIHSISRRDGKLLESVRLQTEEIISLQKDLTKKQEELSTTQKILASDKNNLKIQKSSLLGKEEEVEKKQSAIESQQKEANSLLKELHDKSKEYGEFRDITKEELDAIDDAIAAADKKYPQVTTTTTTKAATTTKKPETDGKDESTTKKPNTTTTTEKTEKPESKYIKLTYPCPSYTKINCAFGAYSGHTGCDFTTKGNENQRIVAAEAGTVILSTDIYCDRSKCRKSYHGKGYCSYGRYIVIRHDKTTSNGKTVYTLYAHNNERVASEGTHVKKGQLIAYSGSTGNSSGPHLHFEVRVGGSSQSYAVDPEKYLP